MKTMKGYFPAAAAALLAVCAAGAGGQPVAGPLLAYCAASTNEAGPGDEIDVSCVLSNVSPASIVISSEGRWLGLSWSGGGVSGRTAQRYLFRRSITANYLTLRPGDAVRQTQEFWVPDQLKTGPLLIRTKFRSLDPGDHFNYLAWTGTVETAAIRITVRGAD